MLLDIILAFVPIITIILLLFVFNLSSSKAGILSFLVTVFIVSIHPPSSFSQLEIVYSSAHGFLISLIVIYVLIFGILLFHLMDHVGLTKTISSFVSSKTNDPTRQVIILAIILSPLIESVSGFGIGIIVIAPILVALGFNRFQAALISLVSLSAVPWGALATGIVIGSSLTDISVQTIGLGSAYLSIPTFIYFALVSVYLVKGKQGLAEKWGEIVTVSGALALGVWISNRWFSVELAGVGGALTALLAEGLFLYFNNRSIPGKDKKTDKRAKVQAALQKNMPIIKILTPYLFLTFLLIISRMVPFIESSLNSIAILEWERYSFSLPLLYSPGFFLILTCLFTIALYRIPWREISKAIQSTFIQLLPIAITTIAFIALAEVMSQSNMTGTLAQAIGNVVGEHFFWISPLIGAFSGLITGSNAASNAMFIQMQVFTGQQNHISAHMMASIQNTSASHMTMASPSRVLLAATITGNKKNEQILFRAIFAIVAVGLVLMMACAWLLDAWGMM